MGMAIWGIMAIIVDHHSGIGLGRISITTAVRVAEVSVVLTAWVAAPEAANR